MGQMTSPRGKLTALVYHLTKKVNKGYYHKVLNIAIKSYIIRASVFKHNIFNKYNNVFDFKKSLSKLN
jgi:hypothetical protein